VHQIVRDASNGHEDETDARKLDGATQAHMRKLAMKAVRGGIADHGGVDLWRKLGER
jgi:hypothetical protein